MQADGGTLFLDEIGEMPLPLQAKLLRALQQGEVQRVGSDTPLTVDVRVIAATNRDLREEAAAGRFREDLYYRLNVITVHVPALRERAGDVPLLAAFFLDRYTEKNRKHLKGFSPQAMDILLRHDWPGNVRELENAIERAVILATGDYVTERELPLHLGTGGTGGTAGTGGGGGNGGSAGTGGSGNAPADGDGLAPYAGLSLEDLERRAIVATLRETSDNKSEAARRLGITRATLHNKLKKYDME